MSIKKIKKHNSQQFLDDLYRVRDVMVITPVSGAYLHINKNELRKEAMRCKIHYYMTEDVFLVRRITMVVV